jgi:hypothetical protein
MLIIILYLKICIIKKIIWKIKMMTVQIKVNSVNLNNLKVRRSGR